MPSVGTPCFWIDDSSTELSLLALPKVIICRIVDIREAFLRTYLIKNNDDVVTRMEYLCVLQLKYSSGRYCYTVIIVEMRRSGIGYCMPLF
jgi:hypothetical protein